ncbi:hypothetical protein [Sodalis sp. dw_96]|uniref:hypothetical protein n=1 Tax=Sodalis sp. dw_96 TaxID=2719794 RepID=UPI001BD24C72|nr:hypothetical protein [Sodalis sp. dw_96]
MPNVILSNENAMLAIDSQMSRGKEQSLDDYLTIDMLFRETYTVQFNGEKKRELGRMTWPENTHETLPETRILFINQLIEKLAGMTLSKQQPLILVSLGSSGLLTEYYIHKGLTNAGFTNLHWRFIDASYHDGQQGLEVVDDFAKRQRARVETFTSNMDYLMPRVPSRPSLWQDCHAGGMVLVSLGSPVLDSRLIQGDFALEDNDISLASLGESIRYSHATYLFASLDKNEFAFE